MFNTWRYEVAQITRVSAQCVWYFDGRERRAYRDKLMCWTANKEAAERASAQLTSALAERRRREAAARTWFQQRKGEIAAIAMETGTAIDSEAGVVAKP